jgi:hypothetical protein
VLSTKKKHIPLSHLTCAVFFTASFLLHSRQKAFFIPVGLLFITAAYEPCRKMLVKTPFDASRYLLLICLASYVAFIGKYGQLHFLKEGPVIESSMPMGACDFVEEHLTHFRKRRLFNQWGWGGYLEYRFHPELRVFMDGRYIFHDFLKVISGAHDSPILWQNFLTAHNIEWVLVRNDSRPVRVPAQIRPGETGTVRIPYLSAYYPSARWALLYRDFESVLYVRRGAFDTEWLNRREIR